MKAVLTYKTVVLAAGETQTHAVTGKVFVVKSATAPFSLSFDGGEFITISEGWTFDAGSDDRGFRFLVLTNPTASPLTIVYYAGNAAMAYSSQATVFSIKNPPTTALSSCADSINNGADIAIAANAARKQIVIQNLDDTSDLDVLDANGAYIASVFYRSAWTVETTAALTLRNNAGKALSIRVFEVCYV